MNLRNSLSSRWRKALLITAIVSFPTALAAQGDSNSDEGRPTASSDLALTQSQLADKYARIEKLMLRMAEFDQASNPRRAELLKKAFAVSREQHIDLQLESIAKLLNQDKFKRAIDNQKQALKDLQALLELLQSENRSDRLKDEQSRIRSYIKEIETLQRMQRSVQGRNEGGIDPEQIRKEQERVSDRTQALDQQITENENVAGDQSQDPEAAGDKPARGQSSDGDSQKEKTDSEDDANESPSDGPGEDPQKPAVQEDASPPDRSQADSNSGDPSKSESGSSGEPSPSGKPSNSGSSPPGPSPPGPSPPGSSPPDGQPPSDSPSQSPSGEKQSFPGHQQIQEAEQKMREAEQRLAEAQKSEALEDQRQAARKLAEAKAKLEEILRQLREEEIERVLAMLELRFRKMLEMELRIQQGTIRLHRIPNDRRDRVVSIEAGKLSLEQRRNVMEADKCLMVLREEGSSIAFPESVQQLRDDMEQVQERLGHAKVGLITQGLEEEIIDALEEMIEALQIAQQEQEDRKNQPQMAPPGDPNDQPLVNQIAELKMLKALQIRINKRTTRYSRLLDDLDDLAGQATDDELIFALQRLSEREMRLHQITHDLSLGKNK